VLQAADGWQCQSAPISCALFPRREMEFKFKSTAF
jgi:hypothetical protein